VSSRQLHGQGSAADDWKCGSRVGQALTEDCPCCVAALKAEVQPSAQQPHPETDAVAAEAADDDLEWEDAD
jgi:hypothetical protein